MSGEWVSLDTSTTSLSSAIRILDAYTQRPPSSPPEVALIDRNETVKRTPGNYYVILDLPEVVDAIHLTIDGRPDYLPVEWKIEDFASDTDDYEPEEIELLPTPAYRFPPGATLVRGTISDSDGPVEGVDVAIDVEDTSAAFTGAGRSDARGEYVLFFREITPEDVTDGSSDSRSVQVDGDDPVIIAQHPDTGEKITETLAIPYGSTTRQDLEF